MFARKAFVDSNWVGQPVGYVPCRYQMLRSNAESHCMLLLAVQQGPCYKYLLTSVTTSAGHASRRPTYRSMAPSTEGTAAPLPQECTHHQTSLYKQC